jgi:NADH-quinone oxidoreductase subunit G
MIQRGEPRDAGLGKRMSQDIVNLEVNGVAVQGRKGQMIIQVTDAVNAYVPRFCYHEKLSVAANCRMCLVEVERAPKPLPACATPIAEGMKVYTKSPKAIAAQKATMEFLLINHPLDCPICDQGGECELQDLAMGFGRDDARYELTKRVVKDKSFGPLISTDMTRCIHCTRCVRFTREVQGEQELGTIGRGENTLISMFVEKAVDHELSGNIIDLCPVGALNSKPARYQGRSWEMTEQPLVAPHDAVGSNLAAHIRRGQLMRVVPRVNDAINETWISDRDRFAYEGIYADDRARTPMIRRDGALVPTTWEVALEAAALALKDAVSAYGADRLGVLGLPTATLEESYLLARLGRALGTGNLDHRLRRRDVRDQAADPDYPGLGIALSDVDTLDGVLVVGSDLRGEAPMLAHRVRKAATQNQAKVAFVHPDALEYRFPVAAYATADAEHMVATLAAIGRAVAESVGQGVPAILAHAAQPTDVERAAAAALLNGSRRLLLLGNAAERHPGYADLRAVAGAVAALAGATLGYLPNGGNAPGATLAGLLPHRESGARPASKVGLDAGAMLAAKLEAYVLFGGLEPHADTAFGEAADAALANAKFVLAITPYASDAATRHAHVVLPIGTYAETSGTYVNIEGRWQSTTAVAKAVGDSRPGWKVLRVLGSLAGLEGFEYGSSEDVRRELEQSLNGIGLSLDTAYRGQWTVSGPVAGTLDTVSLYGADPIVRRARALQETPAALRAAATP